MTTETAPTLISIKEAAAQGITRLRLPKWANPMDHLKIDIIGEQLGPWLHLYAPFNKECNGRDPFQFLSFNYDIASRDWLPYAGPLPDSEEYKAAQAQFDGCLT